MNADEARKLTNQAIERKNKEEEPIVRKHLNDIFKRIEIAAHEGSFGSTFHIVVSLEIAQKICEELKAQNFSAHYDSYNMLFKIHWMIEKNNLGMDLF